MGRKRASIAEKEEARWDERDELQRLDFVAGVVAPTSLAGCVATAALIATGHLEPAASYCLGITGFILLGCAVTATLSLAWSPLQTVRAGKDLDRVIATKRLRTNWALAGLALSIFLGFGVTALIEVAHDGDSHEKKTQQSRPALNIRYSSAELVEAFHLKVEGLVRRASPPVRGDGDAVVFAAGAGDLDRAGVRRGVGVDFEAAAGSGRLAAEGDHPAEVLWFSAFAGAAWLGHPHILPVSGGRLVEA